MGVTKGREVASKGKKMTKNANFSPRLATKGCCAIPPRKINLFVSVSLRSTRRLSSVYSSSSSSRPLACARSSLARGSPLGVPRQPGSESHSRTHRALPLGFLIYTSGGRIYWPQNTMRTCPCPSTETGSRPLVVYLFVVAIHIHPLRHAAATGEDQGERGRRRSGRIKRERERGIGAFCAWPSKFCASATRAKGVVKQMVAASALKDAALKSSEQLPRCQTGKTDDPETIRSRCHSDARVKV